MLKLYNHLSRKKELFRPIRKDRVGLYTCGPTVYNFAHIGNLRTYIFEDILRRTLEYTGYKTRHVMNITDVDDKIIRDAARGGQGIFEFVQPYEKAFFEDLAKLNIQKALKYPKATQHIPEMIRLIQKLLKNGTAYESEGSIYFSIKKFKNYGKLSRVGSRTLKAGVRVDADEYAKDSVQDFVLWKAAKSGEPSWNAPFGKGRPGWHIECSAMSMKYLGETFDIHAGGVDLLFPHHENEIAQSEGASKKPFVKFFMEGEHLLVDGQKMSKSLGNAHTLRDIETRGYNPLAFRYLILTAHYRSKLNFTWESLNAAQNSLERLYEFMKELRAKSKGQKAKGTQTREYQEKFQKTLSDDLNAPKALALVWDIAHDYHANRINNAKEILDLLHDFDRVFGLNLKRNRKETIPPAVQKLAAKRETLRKAKKWDEADRVRVEIKRQGWNVEDTPLGPKIKKA